MSQKNYEQRMVAGDIHKWLFSDNATKKPASTGRIDTNKARLFSKLEDMRIARELGITVDDLEH